MIFNQDKAKLILLFNSKGKLLRKVYDEKNLIEEVNIDEVNQNKFGFPSFQKFEDIISEINEKNYVFEKELEFRKDSKIYTLNFVGVKQQGDILLIGYTSQFQHDMKYVQDIMNMVSEQVNLIRDKTKQIIKISNERDSHQQYFEKFIELNNDLVNLQRELTKENMILERETLKKTKKVPKVENEDYHGRFIELNNDLVNLQRELTKKNILLEDTSKKLKKTNRELELFIESIPNGIAVIEFDGNIILMNSEFKNYYNSNNTQDVGVNDNILELSDNSILLKHLKKIVKNPKEESFQIEMIKEKLWIKLTSKFMFLENEEEPYALLIELHDITDHIKFDNMRNQLISFISHELKNPLSTINLSIESYNSFGKNLSSEEIDQLFGYIDKNVDLLKKITNDLDLFSKTELDKIELKLGSHNLVEIFTQAISQLQPRIEKKRINLYTKFPNEQIHICCDMGRINQVVRILLDNAIKYSEESSRIKLKITNNYSGEYNPKNLEGVLCEIIDDGVGIREEDLINIFEPFYRGKNAKYEKGSGLGLALAKRFVTLHDGGIYLESEYGKGTTSIIFLPKNAHKCE
ncbi:MAG: putative Histidine kinase [Promethearchaeota archaeon]|nr:MAG: putative Histidine kinase [Candidatus Lokiarchaeota archaeon]